jgi:hypothetical protein
VLIKKEIASKFLLLLAIFTDYLQQLLQQEAHLPSAHLTQALQEDLQHLEHAESAAEAVEIAVSATPATNARATPALISLFIFYFFPFGC